MFRRDKGHTLSSFMEKETRIEEEPDNLDRDDAYDDDCVHDEEDYKKPELDPVTHGNCTN